MVGEVILGLFIAFRDCLVLRDAQLDIRHGDGHAISYQLADGCTVLVLDDGLLLTGG